MYVCHGFRQSILSLCVFVCVTVFVIIHVCMYVSVCHTHSVNLPKSLSYVQVFSEKTHQALLNHPGMAQFTGVAATAAFLLKVITWWKVVEMSSRKEWMSGTRMASVQLCQTPATHDLACCWALVDGATDGWQTGQETEAADP